MNDFCNPMDYTVHGILQARILEWVAIPFSTGSSQPRDRTQVSYSAGGFFTSWATRKQVNNYTINEKIIEHELEKQDICNDFFKGNHTSLELCSSESKQRNHLNI